MVDPMLENLQKKIDGLRAQHKQTCDQVLAIEGAIAICQQLVKEIEAAAKPDKPKK